MLTFGSLFAGIGGFDLGFERAGMQCLWQVEKDKNCLNLLQRRWPNVERFEDVREVGRHNLRAVDVICGGFPCQDLSVAGKRKGLAGSRSGVWFEFNRIIGGLTPRWVVIENVPGLLSSNEGRDFAIILRGLAEWGYLSAWRVLDAEYFGLAQRRRRVFIVGCLGSGDAAKVLFESEGGAWDTAPGRETRQNVTTSSIRLAQTSSDGWGIKLDGTTICHENKQGELTPANNARALRSGASHNYQFVCNVFNGYTGGADDNDAQGNHLVAFDARNFREIGDLSFTLQSKKDGYSLNYQPLISFDLQQAGNHSKNLAQTLSVTRTKSVSFSSGVRRLTPLECERLQGFPDGWTNGQSDSVRYRQLGNAVAVPVAEWIGMRIERFDNEQKYHPKQS